MNLLQIGQFMYVCFTMMAIVRKATAVCNKYTENLAWNASKNSFAKKLHCDLMENYDGNLRPVIDYNDSVTLKHEFTLRDIVHLNSKVSGL